MFFPSSSRRSLTLTLVLPVVSLTFATALAACSSDSPGASSDAGETADTGATPGDSGNNTSTDGGVDAATDATSDAPSEGGTKIGAGPYSIAYSATGGVGIDNRPSVTAVFAANGDLDSYTASADESPTHGTTKAAETYMDLFSTLGRWQDGTTGGKFYASPGFASSATQGFHYALVIGGGQLPTSATVPYDVAATTKPTIEDGSLAVGTVTAKANIVFGPSGFKTGFEISVTMPGDGTYTAQTTGGIATPATSEFNSFNAAFFGDMASSNGGIACSGANPCKFSVRGYVGGGGANTGARLAVSFVLSSGTQAKVVRGALLLKSL